MNLKRKRKPGRPKKQPSKKGKKTVIISPKINRATNKIKFESNASIPEPVLQEAYKIVNTIRKSGGLTYAKNPDELICSSCKVYAKFGGVSSCDECKKRFCIRCTTYCNGCDCHRCNCVVKTCNGCGGTCCNICTQTGLCPSCDLIEDLKAIDSLQTLENITCLGLEA